MKTLMTRLLGLILVGSICTSANAADIVDTAVQAGKFKTLATALQATDLIPVLKGEGPFTVFAPTDEAFAKLPSGTVETLLKPENKAKLSGILAYHVVAGKVAAADVVKLSGAKTVNGQRVDIKVVDGKVMLDGAQVVTTDIQCDNGIIHVIDSVILPSDKTIPEVADSAGKFKTLLAGAKAAGLAGVLSGEGPFTVFAPTDEAFAKLPAGTVESLLKPENKQRLVDILKYHVVSGRVYSTDALSAKSAKTLQGGAVTVSVQSGEAKINNAGLVATDIDASNGVIHIIDSVLLPGQKHSQINVHQMLHSAVAVGAPKFNSGDHAGCAAVYEATLRQLMSVPMETRLHNHMKTVLHHAGQQHCPTDRAWTLRHGIDQMSATLATAR